MSGKCHMDNAKIMRLVVMEIQLKSLQVDTRVNLTRKRMSQIQGPRHLTTWSHIGLKHNVQNTTTWSYIWLKHLKLVL